MQFKFDVNTPIYQQITEQIEEAIFTGSFPEETQVPSTTEISKNFKINPATVLKGMNVLVDQGLIEKRRGLGMFVIKGAQQKIMQKRQDEFYTTYVATLIVESKKLGLGEKELIKLIESGYSDESVRD